MLKRIYCLFLSFSVALTPIAGADAKSVFAEVSPSIVVVLVPDGQGSGVVVGDGIVVTNCHVVEEATEVHIKQAADARGAESYLMEAEILAKDEDNDLCLLFAGDLTKPPAAPAAEFGEAKDLVIGEDVYAIGAPQGLDLSLSRGIVAQLRGIKGKAPIVQTDAAISPGSSGGGLFNGDGELVGITTYKQVNGESLNFAMPVEAVAALVHTAQREAEERQAQAALWQECIKNPQYQCVLTSAQQMAKQVGSESYYFHTLNRIAAAQAAAGSINDAQITAQQINDPSDLTRTLTEIAKIQSQDGDLKGAKINLDNALQAAQQIEIDFFRYVKLVDITIIHAEMGNFEGAKTIAQKIENAEELGRAYEGIAKAQAQAGNFNDAKETAQNINHIIYYDEAFKRIIETQVQAGYFDDAKITARQVDDFDMLKNIAIAQAESGIFKDAEITAQQIDDAFYRTEALSKIAVIQAQMGRFDDANANFDNAIYAAKQLDYDFSSILALIKIAIAQAKINMIDEAKMIIDHTLPLAQNIEDARQRIDALRNIAIVQFEIGNASGAKITLHDALQKAGGQATLLENIAIAQAKLGFLDDAIATAMLINNQGIYLRDSALIRIVDAQAQDGKFEVAKIIAMEIENQNFRNDALKDIAVAQVGVGNFSKAKNTIQQIDDAESHDAALRDLAIAQAETGDFTGAMQTMQSINHAAGRAQALASIAYILAMR